MAHQFVMYRDVEVIYEDKQGRRFWGCIPRARFNEITQKFERVHNPRGYGYAGRHRLKYRPKKKYKYPQS